MSYFGGWDVGQTQPRILLLSHRDQVRWLAATAFYEFEDLIGEWAQVDMLPLPTPRLPVRRKFKSLVARATGNARVAAALTPPPLSPCRARGAYDLFLAVLPAPGFSVVMDDIVGLRDCCGALAAYIPEVWAHRVMREPHVVEPLRQFDMIYVSTLHSVEPMAELTGRPVKFLPFGVDAALFAPTPSAPPRAIDVLNIGRRSPVTHGALKAAAQDSGLFYHHDTVAKPMTNDPADHRRMYAELLKRSKFAITNRANADEPDKTKGAEEVGHRFYEAAAAGTVMIGDAPRNACMDDHFDWPDAVIAAPWDDAAVAERIAALDADPARLKRIRTAGIVNCLLRHDWVYRWQSICADLEIDAGTAVQARRNTLQGLAERFEAPALRIA